MSRRRILSIVALVVVLGAVAAGAGLLRRPSPSSASSAPPRAGTAHVVRTDLAATVLTEGALGYAPSAPVVNRLHGTFTALPAPGTTLRPGDVLYRVDDEPVFLMEGGTPAWRSFAPGMSDGPDVDELSADLIVMGDAGGLLAAPTSHYGSAVQAAVSRWQTARGLVADGQIPLGEVVFLAGPALVGAIAVDVGAPAGDGVSPFAVTTTTRQVTVPISANLPPVHVGEQVHIVMPDQTQLAATVTAIGPPPPGGAGGEGGGGQGGGNGGGGGQQAVAQLTVTPADPAATGTGDGVAVQVLLTYRSASNVLAVPVTALLALAGGGYGVEIVGPHGTRHLVGVTTGIFAGSQVEIQGDGIEVGTTVVAAQ